LRFVLNNFNFCKSRLEVSGAFSHLFPSTHALSFDIHYGVFDLSFLSFIWSLQQFHIKLRIQDFCAISATYFLTLS